jgi:hypothetical protein
MDFAMVDKCVCNELLIFVQVDPRWQIIEDSEQRLRLRRVMRTKNFTKVGDGRWPRLASWQLLRYVHCPFAVALRRCGGSFCS